MEVALGKFALDGIATYLNADVAVGARSALGELVRRIEAGAPPAGLPRFLAESAPAAAGSPLGLSVDEHTSAVLEREAARQGTTVGRLAAHYVLLRLAELDRRLPPAGLGPV